MSPNYRLTPLAVADLVDISEYVEANFGIDVADRTLEKIIQALELLATHPDIGHSRPDLVPPPWQIWPVGPSLIAFRPDVSPIWIGRIVRAARDFSGIELEEPDVPGN